MPYTPTPLDLITPADSNHSCFEKVNQNFEDINTTFAEISSLVAGGFDYFKTDLTGGTPGCLDQMDGDGLSDGNKAIVIVGNNPGRTYIYVLDADNSGAEDSPYIIAPDTNPGNKRWVLSARIPRTWKGAGTPTSTNDYNDGVRNGDWWLYGGNAYMCVSETAGNAVWRIIPQLGTGATNAAAGDHNHSTVNIASTAISDWAEAVQDTAGGMWTGNTETGLSVTYDDASGKMNASVTYGTEANTACQGNDARLSDTRDPNAHSHTESDISDFGSYSTTDHDHDLAYSAIGHTHSYAASDHDQSHILGGADVIDGDKLEISWNPTNSTPDSVPDYSDNLDHLTSHLKGIDAAIGGKSDSGHTHSYASDNHDATHITSGSDEIDGDKLDIDWNPSNYTPATVEDYADSVDNLTAHLKGIDSAIGSVSSGITAGKSIALSIVFGG